MTFIIYLRNTILIFYINVPVVTNLDSEWLHSLYEHISRHMKRKKYAFSVPIWLGYDDYIKTGINPKKLVMGIPWYGYDYTCQNLSVVRKDHFLCNFFLFLLYFLESVLFPLYKLHFIYNLEISLYIEYIHFIENLFNIV